ncbi:MAG: transposase [Spirochaetaceae bacterium]|nr:transposase [Spirochaetaceae bacterium]
MSCMRQPRHLVDGAWYHVTARVNRREMLLDRGEVRDLFLAVLGRAKRRYRFHVANFCVMGNHIHLQIMPVKGQSLSAIMRWVLGCFARAYNKKRGLSGHFWGERFHSRVLEGIRQFVIAFGYIDDNPVKAGLAARPCEWLHGGAWRRLRGDASLLMEGSIWLALIEACRELPTALPAPAQARPITVI